MKELTLNYNLYDLPSAQHKAGLAGLLVLIETMRRRGIEPLPEARCIGEYQAELVFTEKSMQAVCDDLYDADFVEMSSKSKWPGKAPKRIEDIQVIKDGKEKKEKRYIYDGVQPKGQFLQTLFPDADGVWVKTWRDMLWGVLRAQPKTRGVYEERANRKPSSEAVKIFKALSKCLTAAPKDKQTTEGIAGTVFIGAQASNAELVSFTGIPTDNFLLHFWPIVSLIFIPRSFSVERSKDRATSIKWDDYGFALAVPEISHLQLFIDDIMDILQQLEVKTVGNRPAQAFIDLTVESGLEYLYHLAQRRLKKHGVLDSASSVEIYHVQRRDKSVRMLLAERLLSDSAILEKYEKIRSQRLSPIYKKLYLNNMLQKKPWYAGAADLAATHPAELIISKAGKTPIKVPFFGHAVNRKYVDVITQLEEMEEHEMNTEEGLDSLLAKRVYELIRQYVRIKAERRSSQKLESFSKDQNGKRTYPKTYREAVEKVCMDAFLAMRGRRDQDFVEYFTGTICSVPQYLPDNDYLLVSQSLIDDWERIKSLSMLALSASSYFSQSQQNKGEEA